MAFSHQVFKKIEAIVGRANCSEAREERLCYGYDNTPEAFYPDAVVFPKNARDVSSVLQLANQYQFPVTPRGAGSGMTGGALPVWGGVVLAMARLNRIIRIDVDNLIAVAEPGVITGDLHRAVLKEGLFYPPDPASSDFCTIGGNAAECAGGPKAVKYGVTRDYVMGLEVVLPTGEIIQTGVETAKGVVGYDLTRLMVGSEGTLGVITRLTLRLLPKPEVVKTATAVFDQMETAAETVSEIIRQGIVPRAIEYMDNASIRCAESHIHAGLPLDAEAMLIIEVDGSAGETAHSMQKIETVCRAAGVREFKSAANADETAGLWKARKAVSPALFAYGPDKINEDIVVPRSKIPDIVKKIKELSLRTGLTMVSFGHAGDGNIHFNIMLDKQNPEALQKAHAAVNELFDYTLSLSGTISGEHGIGTSKSPYMAKEISPESLALMRRIKSAFDPAGILNPGKMLV
ncbi:MAG: FAD-binding protein [Desulfobacteraceae bacterium]|nr:FAD-binding protein [Desulfobacteraceae bacterium]